VLPIYAQVARRALDPHVGSALPGGARPPGPRAAAATTRAAGREAGRLLMEPDTEREVMLPLELVVRHTTARSPAQGTFSGPLSV
jgi:hypothetical protein